MEPWWAGAAEALWRECDFRRKPSYQATWERFAELEDVAAAFTEVPNLLIQHARRHTGGKVGRDIHVDGTEAETNARLQHDCREGESRARRARRRGHPVFPRRVNAEDARATRHENSAEPTAEDETSLDIGDATEIHHAKSVFEHNPRAGIASVLPYRKYHGAPRRADTDTLRYDRHGVARCQHCGGPGRLLRFTAQSSPRLWFACELPVTPECEREQTIACSHDWRVDKGLHLPYGPAAAALRERGLLPTEEFGPSPPGDDDRPF